jgi:hypothetical protein
MVDLGKGIYKDFPEVEQDDLMLFIWVGCSMHKEMNSMKGGNKAMRDLYEEMRNAAVLDDAPDCELEFTDVERHAYDSSTHGGVKATSIAGALFNDKDKKKGWQDTVRSYFEPHLGKFMNFPDTSNNWYQTHAAAATKLLLHLDLYKEFLEVARDSKGHFNHMEQNLYNALNDKPTIVELAVLALYAQAVTHPYMR